LFSKFIFLFTLSIKFIFSIHLFKKSRRGVFESRQDISGERLILKYKLPLNEIILDFFDKLKKATSGYAR
jgi:GTP-binding protein LepA